MVGGGQVEQTGHVGQDMFPVVPQAINRKASSQRFFIDIYNCSLKIYFLDYYQNIYLSNR